MLSLVAYISVSRHNGKRKEIEVEAENGKMVKSTFHGSNAYAAVDSNITMLDL